MQIFHQNQRRGSKCQSTNQHDNDTAVEGMTKRGTITSLVKQTKPERANPAWPVHLARTCWPKHLLQLAGRDTFSERFPQQLVYHSLYYCGKTPGRTWCWCRTWCRTWCWTLMLSSASLRRARAYSPKVFVLSHHLTVLQGYYCLRHILYGGV